MPSYLALHQVELARFTRPAEAEPTRLCGAGPRLAADEWRIVVVEPRTTHHYQPGYLFVPFGTYDPEDIVRALAGHKTPPPATVPVEAPQVDPPAAVADGPSNELQLTDVDVEPTDSDNRYRFRFAVLHPGNDKDQVVGTIWIAVNGLSNGKPVRLSLKQVSSETRPYLDMRFTGQQSVDGELTLPPDFEPKNIAIEAKPYDNKYRGASGKFDWTVDG